MRPETRTEAGRLIHAVNMDETYRRRQVRGRDLNDWHPQLDAWWAAGDYTAILDLLGEVITAAETLEQYDDREPEAYWYQQAAKAHTVMGDHAAAVAVLERWFQFWPPERIRFDREPERMERRLAAARRRAIKAAGAG
jgi:tetratricopeptide (TPR) repeat protein